MSSDWQFHGFNLLAPFKCWPHVFNCKSGAEARTWCLLCSMCRLNLKIAFLCLRPGLRFNLQTLVCICHGLGLSLVDSKTPSQRPRHTQQHDNKPRGDWEAAAEEGPADVGGSLSQKQRGNWQPTVAGKKEFLFYLLHTSLTSYKIFT